MSCTRVSLDHSGFDYLDILLGAILTVGLGLLNGIDNVHTVNNLTKHSVLTVKVAISASGVMPRVL